MPKRSARDRTEIEQTSDHPTTQSDTFTISGEQVRDAGDDVSDSEDSSYSGLESEEDTSGPGSSEGWNDSEELTDSEDHMSGSSKKGQGKISHDLSVGHLAVDTDTSDEEDARNTVGNIPVEWYHDYPHIGYDLDGKRIMKPAKGDELDKFLAKMDNPNYWRTIQDKYSGKDLILTNEELDIINKIQQTEFPVDSVDSYEPQINFFTYDKMVQPLQGGTEPKSRFVPSKWEAKKVMKIVHAIRNGWIKSSAKKEPEKPHYYLLWNETSGLEGKHRMYIPAPKMKLPGHEESYNPPPEYLPTDEERKKWEGLDPEDRERNFLPQRYASLREVPAYPRFMQERFERCLDLYLCPRQRRMKVNIDNPDILLPKLPKPKELQPFPSTLSITYTGHTGMVRCISIDSHGQWLASGSSDCSVKLWEVCSGRCVRSVPLAGVVESVAFCPNQDLTLIAIVVGKEVRLVNHGLGDKLAVAHTNQLLTNDKEEDNAESSVVWTKHGKDEMCDGLLLSLGLPKAVKQVVWHNKGDYFATVMPEGGNNAVYIHQLSRQRSQNPFQRSKGLVQKVMFHPNKPLFFVATQRYVRVYNLAKQELVKKLMTGVKWVSSIDVHPQGDNVIVGSYDKALSWFDMELSTKPYKVMKQHKQAVRQVCYHRRYPLFASASDDGTVIVSHGMVYSDLLKNPLIVPLKIIRGHSTVDNFGVLDVTFHPVQPWVFSAGADCTVKLFT